MTEQPVAPAPAAAAPAQPAPAPLPAPAPATDPAAELARVQAELEQWKGHARGWEQKAKANLTAAQQAETNKEQLAKVAQALGIETATPTPEQIAQQLAAATAEKAQLARERAVLLAASTVGANAAALLDSRAFAQQLAGIDPADSAAVQAAMKAAIDANPLYAAPAAPQQPAPPAAPPVRQASAAGQFGQPAGNTQWTADDVAKASPDALAKAMKEGRLANYMAS